VRLTRRLVNGKIEIPVIVNVLYRTAAENISDAQIQSQIDVLNDDFNATNSDFNSVPAH
jgi:tRNA1(Val) A37 N6-methylase TrmN6